MIHVRALSKAFGNNLVLRQLDLTLEPGQSLTLVGPNGAGKTTLLRILATLTKPTSGRVTLAGYDLASHPIQARRNVGWVSHQPLLYHDLSAEQNLVFYARLYDVPQPGSRTESLLQQVGLWSRRREPVRTFSRGMLQRLAIARALIHQPPVLLLDEPDTGLDVDATDILGELLGQADSDHTTKIATTHNLERGLEWGDRVAILAGGRIVFQADRADLTRESFASRYKHLTTGA